MGAAVVISPPIMTKNAGRHWSSAFGGRLVQLGRMEFISSVDDKLQQLGRGCVVCCKSDELHATLLPDLSCFGDTGIKLTDGLLHDLDPGISVGQLVLELLHVVLVICG